MAGKAQKVYYKVSIPDFGEGDVAAYSVRQALALFIQREMKKRNSNVWWDGRQYKGLAGEREFITDVLTKPDFDKFVTELQDQPKLEVPEIKGPEKKPQQLAFDLPHTTFNSVNFKYDPLYRYSFHGEDGTKVTASSFEDFEKIKEQVTKKGTLHIYKMFETRKEALDRISASLLDKAEEDENVKGLLSNNNLNVEDLQDIDITISSNQVEAPIVTKASIEIGLDSFDSMYDEFLIGLDNWVSKDYTQVSKKATLTLDDIISSSETVADFLYEQGLPRFAVELYTKEEGEHPAIKFKIPELIPHMEESVMDKFKPENKAKSVAIDFDGTIATYKGEDQFPDIGEPEEGVLEALDRLKTDGWFIAIYSCRNNDSKNIPAMEEWLKKNKIPYDEIWTGKGKPFADAYIDDKGIQYNGNWKEVTKQLKSIKTSSILCKKCNLYKVWHNDSLLWKCLDCGDNSIMERVACHVFGLKNNDSVSYSIGQRTMSATLSQIVHKDANSIIWKTSNGDIVKNSNLKLNTKKSSPDPKEHWLREVK